MDVKKELIKKYSNNSKHSNYQVLPSSLKFVINDDDVETRTRFEKERLDYILKKIEVRNKSVLDIGGNTGFFTFELIDAGAKSVHYYEGNTSHADFIDLASKYLNLGKKIKITNKYFSFEGDANMKYDIILLLNVLHHLGDDYGDQGISIDAAKQNMLVQLNSLHSMADVIVFQLGFNWKGNPNNCLFEDGTKKEMIDFVKTGVNGYWDIIEIGIAEKKTDNIVYCELSDKNIERDDSLGEFLNRPLFILKANK